jgi:SSS family solute:Na+ symporter
MSLFGIDSLIIFLYFLGMIGIGLYYKKSVKTSQDYFLSGKNLSFWVIGMSIVATDIGAVEFVGLAGQAYRFGIVAGNYDWIGSVPAMILAAMVFVPYYWRAGIYTVPEYLGRRFNSSVQSVMAVVWLFALAFNLGIMLWVTGTFLNEMFGWPIMLSIFLTVFVVCCYTIIGGLAAVVMTDVVQLVLMFIGGGLVLILGLNKLGGWENMMAKVQSMGPGFKDHFSLIHSPKSGSPYPWTGILFGLTAVLSPAYYIGSQAIVQRSLGARDEWHAKAGVLCGAVLKMFIPVLVVFPGIVAVALFPDVQDGDRIYMIMIKNLLPTGLLGLVVAAFFAALMSTVASSMHSAATIWSKDIFEKFIKKNASDRYYLNAGRLFTGVLFLIAVISAPLSQKFPGIYVYVQTLNSFFQGPVFAVLLLGMFWKRTTPWAGFFGLISGIAMAALMFTFKSSLFTLQDPFFYISWWSFVGSLAITVVVTFFTKPLEAEKLQGLVYHFERGSRSARAKD